MEHPPKVTCDACPAVRGEVNHWYRYKRGTLPGSISFSTWDDPIAAGDPSKEDNPGKYRGHVCGVDCAAKILVGELGKSVSVPDSGNERISYVSSIEHKIPPVEWRCERGECGGTCAGCREDDGEEEENDQSPPVPRDAIRSAAELSRRPR